MREWLLRLGLLLFGVGLALGVGLVGLQLIGQQRLVEQVTAPCEPAVEVWMIVEVLHDYRQPCSSFYWDMYPTDEFYNLITLNNYGLHDTNLTLDKPDDVYRILIVGDSFPQGWQVTLQEGFPWLLEQQLNADFDRPVEIINLSVDTYGTDRQLLLYSVLGWRFQPDVVLLAFYLGNDVKDNYKPLVGYADGFYDFPYPIFSLADDQQLTLHNIQPLDPARFPDSPVWAWLADHAAEETPAPEIIPPTVPRVTKTQPRQLEYPVDLGLYLPEDDNWGAAWSLSEALVLQFRDLVQASGSRFGVLVIPDRRAVHASEWDTTTRLFPVVRGMNPLAPGDRLDAFLAQNQIPALNLTYALSGWALAHPNEYLYYPGDGHFNANGHAVSAQRIRYWLTEVGWVPG